MSQLARRAVVWSVVIGLLLIGIFLQIKSAKGAISADPPIMAIGKSPGVTSLFRF